MIAATQRLRNWMFTMEVPGSSTGKFSDIFHAPFYSSVTVLLEYVDPVIYSWLGFAL